MAVKFKNVQSRINSATWFFGALILTYVVAVLLLSLTGAGYDINIIQNICISQGMILFPTIAYVLITGCSLRNTMRYKRTHWSAIFIVPVFVVAVTPLTSLLNSISLLWVDSATTELSSELVANYPLWVSALLMAVTPAVVEEAAYRGVVLGNYRYGNRLVAIIMSGVLFGVMHMNFNQMPYAMVLGILLGLLAEATDSILATMYAHFCFNFNSVLLSYIVWHVPALSELMEKSLEAGTSADDLKQSIVLLIPTAFMGLCVGLALIFALAVINKRQNELLDMFRRNRNATGEKRRIVNTLFIVVLCISLAIVAFFQFFY